MADQAERLRELVRQKQQVVAEDNSKCKIITVTSGKGGVGKTNLASNLAISFSMLGQRVLIMDADLGLSNVNIITGLIPPPKYNLSHVISGEKDILEVIAHGPCGIKVITGAVGVTKVANMGTKKRNDFIESLDSLLPLFDLIFIDTSAGLSENVLSFVLSADEVILVTTPEPTAITDAYGMIKAIAAKNEDIKVGLVVNRIQNIIEGKKVSDKIVNIAEQFLGLKIERLGYIMEDALVRKAVSEQAPFFVTYPNSKAANCISHIRNKLAEIPEENHKCEEKGFFSRLFQGFQP
ncbi:MAG: MinD/ParA family protein [bacterium]|nr:MinD/ParA family protein [bacterium]